jgi:hypothetical protein
MSTKEEYSKEIVDTVHQYFDVNNLGDVLQVLSNASFDHLKSTLTVGNMANVAEVNKAACAVSTITDVMALLGTLHECTLRSKED